MIDEPIRWSHAYGKPVVPSSWQMTRRKESSSNTYSHGTCSITVRPPSQNASPRSPPRAFGHWWAGSEARVGGGALRDRVRPGAARSVRPGVDAPGNRAPDQPTRLALRTKVAELSLEGGQQQHRLNSPAALSS
jgi:hypothetical protein